MNIRMSRPSKIRSVRYSTGFSLIEVLMAIFILGIGIISIAALFPVGMVQQRKSVDDIMGPSVAHSALAIIRSKVSPEQFGTFEEFSDPAFLLILESPRYTQPGDWNWMRPSFIFEDDTDSTYEIKYNGNQYEVDESGAIDIFSHDYWRWQHGEAGDNIHRATEFHESLFGSTGWIDRNGTPSLDPDPRGGPLWGIPYNTDPSVNPDGPPRIHITQRERYYPIQSELNSATDAIGNPVTLTKPQYVWDCMFRRFQGKIYVAIFVYRVTRSSGQAVDYIVQPNDISAHTPYYISPDLPPIPVWLDLVNDPENRYIAPDAGWDHFGPNDPPGPADYGDTDTGFGGGDDHIVWGYDPTVEDPEYVFDLQDPRQAWQAPRQWILDQNGSVHQVLDHFQDDPNEPMQVELMRPVMLPAINLINSPSTPYYWPQLPTNGAMVSDIWYVPLSNREGHTLTPVYVMVKEL